MISRDTQIECGEHDKRCEAFICQHLESASGRGFNYAIDEVEPDGLWPDAWCDLCNVVFEAEGEWTEKATNLAGIKLVCDLCYESARERNWLQDEESYNKFLTEAVNWLDGKQAEFREQFKIGMWERYDWSQDTGQLIFSHNGKARVKADVLFVGSISTLSGTWLWSWANPSIEESVKSRIREVQNYGQNRNFIKLSSARWRAVEEDGWEMAAISGFLLNAIGAYRTPDENGFTFLVLKSAHWIQ